MFPFLSILLALATVEGLAWWWMHPAPAGPGQPVLAYRPVGLDRRLARQSLGDDGAGPLVSNGAENQGNAEATASSSAPSSIQHSKSNIPNPLLPPSTFDVGSSTFDVPSSSSPTTTTPLPEIYQKAAPMLRCSSGRVFHVACGDGISLHLAFFAWDGTDTGSVLEAFRHMPEACMGSIGMKLVSKGKPIPYTVGLDRRAGRDSANGVESERREIADRGSKIAADSADSSNPQSSISPSSSDHRSLLTIDRRKMDEQFPSDSESNHSITFDHTMFRDPGQGGGLLTPGPLIHAFRAVWVSGITAADARKGLDGNEFDRLRAIRLKSALTRFRPAHARVIQGTVRGAPNRQAAWHAFERNMLRDLTFER